MTVSLRSVRRLVVVLSVLVAFAAVAAGRARAEDFKEEVDNALKDIAGKTSLTVDEYEKAKRTLETYRDKRAQYLNELVKAVGSDEFDVASTWGNSCSNGKSALEEVQKLDLDKLNLKEMAKGEEQLWNRLKDSKIPASRKKILAIREQTRRKTEDLDALWEKFARVDKDVIERIKEIEREQKEDIGIAQKGIDELKDQSFDKVIEALQDIGSSSLGPISKVLKKLYDYRKEENEKPMTTHARLYEAWHSAHEQAEDVAKGIDHGQCEHEMEYIVAFTNEIPLDKTRDQFQRQVKDQMARHMEINKRDWEEFKKRNNGRLIGKVTTDYWSIVADPDLLKPDEDVTRSVEQVDRALKSIEEKVNDKMRSGPEKEKAKQNIEAMKKSIEDYRAAVKRSSEIEKEGQNKAQLN